MVEIPKFPALAFDEASHIYRLNGIVIPSVTQVMEPLSQETYRGIDSGVLRRAANKGTGVHNSINSFLDFGIEDVAPEHRGYFNAFMAWLQKCQPEVLASEYRLYHRFMGYAGTADLLCVIGGKVFLIDYKTTQRIEVPMVTVQLEAYLRALDSHGLKCDAVASLHLRRDGTYEFETYSGGAETWAVFSALLTVWKYKQQIRR